MRTITTEIYNYEELMALYGNDENVRKNVLSAYVDRQERDFSDFHSYDIVKSLQALGEVLGTVLKDWSFGLHDRCSAYFNVDAFANQTNEEKKEIVEELDKLYNGDFTDLTGAYSDLFIREVIKKDFNGQVAFNDLHRFVKEVATEAVTLFTLSYENTIYSPTSTDLEEWGQVGELEFTKEGSIYF